MRLSWLWGLLALGCGTDADGDGWLVDLDCDDTNPALGGPEVPYDGFDNDCDSSTPDDDLDGDGHRRVGDCNDDDPSVGGPEVPYDGFDNDCDPSTPDDDLDEDGLLLAQDCNDDNPSVGGPEIAYDGVDNDCDPSTPDDDLDGDGALVDEDCDDLDGEVIWVGAWAEDVLDDDVQGFCSGYCERGIVGSLALTARAPDNLGDDLACVTWVGQDVVIVGTGLADLTGLSALSAIGDDLEVRDNPSLDPAAISAWVKQLDHVGGTTILSGNGEGL